MDAPTPWLIELLFLWSSSLSILGRAFAASPLLACIYLVFILAYAIGCFKLHHPDPVMFHSPLSVFNLFIFCTLQLSRFSNAQNPTSTTSQAGTPTTFRPIFTVPSSADFGMYIFQADSFCFGLRQGLRDMYREQNMINTPSSCLVARDVASKKGY